MEVELTGPPELRESNQIDKSVDELLAEFLSIESELCLFDLQINGVPVWELVRYQIYLEVLERAGLHSFERE